MKSTSDKAAVIRRILVNVKKKHLPLAAGGLAYYFLMSLFPALVALTAVMSSLPIKGGMQAATSFMARVIPPPGISLIDDLLAVIAPHRTGLLSFGIIAALWLASKGFKGVIWGLDMVYDTDVPRPLWVSRILAFGLTFAVGLLLLVGVVLTLSGPALGRLISRVVPVASVWPKVWPFLQWSLSALLLFAAIELLYLLVPRLPEQRRLTLPGAVFAASAWLALTWGLGLYFKHFGELKIDNLYGLVATPLAFMGWLYWSAGAILVGAEINSSLLYYRTRKRPEPKKVLPRKAA